MKTLLFLASLLLLPFAARADDVNIAWDWDPPTGTVMDPDMPISFRIEIAPITKPDAWRVKVEGLTAKTYTLKDLAPGAWNARVFAVAGGVKSDPSNLLKIEIAPLPPRQPVKVAIQTSTDLKNWTEIASAWTGEGVATAYYRTVVTSHR